MANEQNLKPFTSDQSREEAVKNGRNGGKKSGEVRRQKKTFKQIMTSLLELKPADPEVIRNLEANGIDPEEITNKTVLALSMYSKAAEGDVNAAKLVMSMIAEDIQHEELELKKKELKAKAESKKNDEEAALQKLDEVLEKMIGGAE